jgi:hypothetical protein
MFFIAFSAGKNRQGNPDCSKVMEPKEIRKRIRQLISDNGPMTREEILVGFDGSSVDRKIVTQTVNNLISLQILFQASGKRVWDQDQNRVLKAEAKKLIQVKDYSKTELATELGRLNLGVSAYHIKNNLFPELLDEPDVFLTVKGRTQYLTKERADLNAFAAPLAEKYQEAKVVLEKSGYSKTQIQEAIIGNEIVAEVTVSRGNISRIRPPTDEAEIDFQRDAAELLVLAWKDCESEEAKDFFEGVMISLGLDPEGKPGEIVKFDGLIHVGLNGIGKDDEVIISKPGWRLKNRRGNYLITKATIQRTAK